MGDLFLNLLANALWVLSGAALVYANSRLRVIRPTRMLWQFRDIGRLTVISANSVTTDTGEYGRPATGIGQVRALACLIESLNKGYGTLSISNILLSTDQVHERLEQDLILLGGPKNNRVTAAFLNLLADHQPATATGSRLFWRALRGERWQDGEYEEFAGKVEDKKVVTDYGLIVRTENPFASNASNSHTAVLIAGSHTYGTVAAAKYLVEHAPSHFDSRTLRRSNFSLIVSCKVLDDYPIDIRLEKEYVWEQARGRRPGWWR